MTQVFDNTFSSFQRYDLGVAVSRRHYSIEEARDIFCANDVECTVDSIREGWARFQFNNWTETNPTWIISFERSPTAQPVWVIEWG